MRAILLLQLLLVGVMSWGAPAAAQGVESIPEGRLVELRADPVAPGFGEVFDLHLTLRLAPGIGVFFPDTLLATGAAESVGTGRWSVTGAQGDSIDVRAVYPVIGYREALVEVPWIELWLGPLSAMGGGGAVRAAAELPANPPEELQRRMLRLGAVDLGVFAPMEEEGIGMIPRPPADVLGARWSLWLLVGAGLIGAAGLAAAGVAARRAWRAGVTPLLGRRRIRSPRAEALRELEAIRAEGWHRNGRVDEFYLRTSGVVRRFAAEVEPGWGPELTSTELVDRLTGRSAGGIEALAPALDTSERVKFGGYRPEAPAAEADWGVIRDWIRAAPENGWGSSRHS